jgi:mono/diheme cytochrome c family protein
MTKSKRVYSLFLASTLLLIGASSCVQKMGKIGHMKTYGPNALRVPPAGTVAKGSLSQANKMTKLPSPIPHEMLVRGQERYNIYCSPCHDYTGQGNGMIVQRGFLAPPSYHSDRLISAPDQHFVDVITQGYGAMYSYADRVPLSDRWAITAYIRALQLSENMRVDKLRPDETKLLQEIKE